MQKLTNEWLDARIEYWLIEYKYGWMQECMRDRMKE